MAQWTIYCHIHVESRRFYVGLTKKRMLQRWQEHVCNASKKRGKGCRHFWNAIRTYGKDAFSHHVLGITSDLDEANQLEDLWIFLLDSTNPGKGFNLAKGGKHTPHPVRNPWDRPEFREKALANLAKVNASMTHGERSARTIGLWKDPEFQENVVSSTRLALSTPEAKEAMSAAQRAAKARPDVRKRQSEASKRMWESDEYRARNAIVWQDPKFRRMCQTGLVAGAALNKSKTHCCNGHEYSPENVYVDGKGSRVCRQCRRKNGRKNMRAKRVRDAASA